MKTQIRRPAPGLLTALLAAGIIFAPSAFAQIEEIVVTANKREQGIQDVSTSITALDEEAINRAGIVDITGLETVVPGLRIGTSGGEVRPALRGARTNEVGVAGTGIAEQVVGIFQDGIYTPTTTAGLGAYTDVRRIEVLRGPQGTLYGRNTFAGSINIISNEPNFDGISGSLKATYGSYSRKAYDAVVNVPLTDTVATRFVMASDTHDPIIENHFSSSDALGLRDRNRFYARSTSLWNINDRLSATLRWDYSRKDQNADAIWGYQQTAARQVGGTVTGGFTGNSTSHNGHVYAGTVGEGDDAMPARQDLGPYDVYRDAPAIDEQKTRSTSLILDYAGNRADVRFTLNQSNLKGTQMYDANYSEANSGFDFGRRDDQDSFSMELQLTSVGDGPFSWVAGFYQFDQETMWEWLTYSGYPAHEVSACCGSPAGLDDPHTVTSQAIYGQGTWAFSDSFRVIGGLRWNSDDKEFTPHGRGGDVPEPGDWDDSATLWKFAIERDVGLDSMFYFSAATGYRTGGANEARAAAAGGDLLYGNEDVTSYEVGLKNTLRDGTMTLNLSAFSNQYSDVKAQLFVRGDVGVDPDTGQPVGLSFEYYENGGDVDSTGAEVEMLWAPNPDLLVDASLTWLNSEFGSNYNVGSTRLRPLLGLGNIDGRQDVTIAAANLNNENSQFNFGGWTPALSPELTLGFGFTYDIYRGNSVWTPSLRLKYVDEYYAFDTNIPEVLQEAHWMGDARLTWVPNNGDLEISWFMMNLFDEEVMTRAVVHNRGILTVGEGDDAITGPVNSVQVNWNTPRTWGLSLGYRF